MTKSKVLPLVRGKGKQTSSGLKDGEVTFVGAGPGEADLITLRGYRAIQRADVILYDNLIDHALMDECEARLVYVGKRCGLHSMSQNEICETLVSYAQEGLRVVRLKGGDPSVFGRLGEELEACVQNSIPFEVVPGISSSIATSIFAGIPITYRGVADSFTVVTAHKKSGGEGLSIPHYSPKTTLVLMMGKSTTPIWQEHLFQKNYPSDLPVAFISRACTDGQEVTIGTLGSALEISQLSQVKTPCTVVVGEVVRLHERYEWFQSKEQAKEQAKEPDAVEKPALLLEAIPS